MATINDVARLAGVSPSTVSYALSGKRPIGQQTRDRIEKAVAALGYRPHAGAQALAARRSHVLGLLAPRCESLGAAVVRQFVNGILDEAGAHEHDVLLLNPADGTAGLRRAVDSALVSGVILMDADLHDARLEVLRERGTPTVVIGYPDSPGHASCVDLDFAGAAALAVQYLARRGPRRIALLGSPALLEDPPKSYAVRTRAGFLAAARAAAVEFVDRPCEPTPEGMRDWLGWLDRAQPGTDGIVVQNEAALSLLLGALARSGRGVPASITVAAICPRAIAEGQDVPLACVDIPGAPLGARATRMLLGLLDGHRDPVVELAPPQLYEPATC